jgi:Domain of unknown function (DUF4279)
VRTADLSRISRHVRKVPQPEIDILNELGLSKPVQLVEYAVAERSLSAASYRFFLYLFVVHPTMAPEEIGENLGMEAHIAHRVGAPRRTPKGTPLSGTYANTVWRHSVEHVIANQGFEPEVARLVDKLEPHKAFLDQIKSTGGTATIGIQFMDGLLSDEISCTTLARLVNLGLSLGIENFAGAKEK